MPRAPDAIFAKVDCRILYAQRFNGLKLTDQAAYLKLWILGVRERSAVLEGSMFGIKMCAHLVQIERKLCAKCVSRIAQKKLIAFLPDETIILYGIMESHEMLHWKPVPIMYQDMYFQGTYSGTKEGGELDIRDRYRKDRTPDVTTCTPESERCISHLGKPEKEKTTGNLAPIVKDVLNKIKRDG